MQLSHAHEDKFAAIGGIAQRVSELTGDEYIAGLFRRDFIKQLQWYVPYQTDLLRYRPTKWRAPSWSWASLDRGVIYDFRRVGREMVSLVRYDLSHVDLNNPYGAMTAASVTLSGRLIEGSVAMIGFRAGESVLMTLSGRLIEGSVAKIGFRAGESVLRLQFGAIRMEGSIRELSEDVMEGPVLIKPDTTNFDGVGAGSDDAIFLLILGWQWRFGRGPDSGETLSERAVQDCEATTVFPEEDRWADIALSGLVLQRSGPDAYSRCGNFRTYPYSRPSSVEVPQLLRQWTQAREQKILLV
ncbi:hypothetical protein BAUCODRAFT_27371 [Baudoinia panamericana UAMH 10762]|uniref:Heterokaryon incompatibility domain-containing protein n=1 Tax=Baudoinia panamericana (strain UAMH 10762) TaxID=717646 RepID=M2MNR9_BAUPA|nr:uncharacterized protein BAUCODRAFT_27371 [Baudoinia panamericana UAMH 10762]EMC93093.1 hypothetical protein BAUCODRAFT_27371 [Baudoinia panamericana UAMH 10762]